MPSSTDIIIISGYKTKVRYYGMLTMPAWVIGASLVLNAVLLARAALRLLGL